MKKIAIIGSGWYGCHIASILMDIYDVTIYEKNDVIFNNSSFYNQNRLHLGYHYPRNYATRNMCYKNYDRFKKKYSSLVDNIENNYYAINDDSIIDYNTYVNIYKQEKFEFEIVDNKLFNNVGKKIIKVNEQVINSERSKEYFMQKLKNVKFCFNTKVINFKIKNNKKIILNVIPNYDEVEYDYLFDCSYNQLELSTEKYIYEKTISLVFLKKNNIEFDALTIMDGKFSSLYPRNIQQNIYTLTDVEFTPLITSNNFLTIDNFELTEEKLINIKQNMINKFINIYPSFLHNFEYNGYFLSNKTKMFSMSDSRDVTIEKINDNVITVNCGKIYGIFEFEDYIKNMLNIN